MARRVLIVRRRGGLLNLEIGILALAAGYEVVDALHWHWLWGVAVFFATIAVLVLLFFRSKVSMYLVGGAFSLGWGALAFRLLHSSGQPDNLWTGPLLGAAVAALSLWTHKRTFDAFNSDEAEVVNEL